MRDGKIFKTRIGMVWPERNVALQIAAIPFSAKADRTQDFPATGIGHAQGQAAIGVALGKHIHPVAIGPAGHNLWRAINNGKAFQFHGITCLAVQTQALGPHRSDRQRVFSNVQGTHPA